MSAFEELDKKPIEEITALEAAVLFLSGKHPEDADEAAAELAALQAENARLRDALKRVSELLARWEEAAKTSQEWKHQTYESALLDCYDELAAALSGDAS